MYMYMIVGSTQAQCLLQKPMCMCVCVCTHIPGVETELSERVDGDQDVTDVRLQHDEPYVLVRV